MTPRLKSSKKSTPFPQEFADQIKGAFLENFKDQLKNSELVIQGRIYPEEILLRVGFIEKGQLKQNNFEVSAAYDYKKDNAIDSIHVCVDFLASILNQYFELTAKSAQDEDFELDLPYSWKAINFEKNELYFQFSTVNTMLEDEADKLLGASSDSLVQDEEVDFEDVELEADEEEDPDDDPSKRTIH